MPQTTTPGLVIVDAGDGEPHWIGASRVTVKATRDDTGGAYGLILSEARRGTAPPLHVHHRCDEAIWVISGRLRLRCGEDEFELGPGGFVLLPRGIAHGFHALEDATMLGIVTPGGEEGFFAEAGPVATTAEPPAPDLPRLQRVATRYGDEFVGPPITLD